MARFRDCLGREWGFRVTVGDLPRMREIGLDLATLVTSMEQLPEVLFGDAERLATALYRLAKPSITPGEFAEGIDGPTLEAGGAALIEACCDFFPLSRTASEMKRAVREKLADLDRQMAERISNASVGSSPVSSESTPAT